MSKRTTKLKISPALQNIDGNKTLRELVSETSHRPTSGSVITRVNFPLLEEDIAKFDQYSEENHAMRVSVLRAGLRALEMLGEEQRSDLIREAEFNRPKTGRKPVKK
ncbi:TPA: hypothetical protein ACNMQV_005436 [Klebsiella pneumoniae]|uniref:hypothetical protein n=1 Tax=Enterobacteriaceae TaxID=543 RepID=UPI0005EEC2E3|nr:MULTISPECIES: hypothetical protein [Enterobacteriaceae]EKV7254855.1 hypothetical protein [Escherichia coli]APV28451.1 hypothetical protein A6P56_29755 [Klebsiella pneumoniae]EIW0319871.1 hypothetical protein [Klebsiella pneumoniae]EKX1285519.1 hypothetical protein [Klebsiella pneumoniae]EKX1301931.1 hypothetical protein [Klebsiella pneumoniae]